MGGEAIEAYGAVLDGSLTQIREASRDARTFDRAAVHRAADVWDNNTYPLFRAAGARTARGRERRARTGLRWMSELGPERREWMVGLLGPGGERLVPPVTAPVGPARDHLGLVRPEPVQLTAASCEELALDYLLPGAEVRLLRLEREGDRLTALVRLAVPRRFTVDGADQAPPAQLTVSVEEVTEAHFDSSDVCGATPTAGADGVTIALGAGGTVSGGTATTWVDDPWWHLSRAGRRAAEKAIGVPVLVPRRGARPHGELNGPALMAATVLWHAMIQMRRVRLARSVGDLHLREMCDAFDGAGAAVVAAGARRTSWSREAAFGRLLDTWIGRTGPVLHKWLGWVLDQHGMPGLPARHAACGPARTSPSGPAALRLAQYTAPQERLGSERPAEALLHLAVPSGDDAETPWRMHVPEPFEPARFRLRTEAFRGTGRLVAGDFENGPGALVLSPR
ncbi:hypothetical protein [Streptomyces sp. CO7]